MTEGYVSDVNGDETVMDSPDCVVSIDTNRISREQAITLANEGEAEKEWAVKKAISSKSFDHTKIGTIEFHIPLEKAVMMLVGAGVIDTTEVDDEAE